MNLQLAEWIRNTAGFTVDENQTGKSVAGGCINDCRIYATDREPIFIKFNARQHIDLFKAESQGLERLRNTNTIRVPKVYGCGVVGQQAVLLLEAIALKTDQSDQAQAEMGLQLAALHASVNPKQLFGLCFDNHIGKTPQINSQHTNWADFFIANRLDYQFNLASKNGYDFADRSKLYQSATALIGGDYQPKASLVHGDLWGGNAGFDENNQPVLFDPAVYYGDPETDIAFTKMFGGFTDAFYTAYREVWPASSGTEQRHQLYNLYHLLNHFNLFGGSYRQQTERTIADLI